MSCEWHWEGEEIAGVEWGLSRSRGAGLFHLSLFCNMNSPCIGPWGERFQVAGTLFPVMCPVPGAGEGFL